MSTILQDHEGWLKCDGRLLDSNEYSNLFNVVGYTFGGSGRFFNIPDGRGRIAAAIGPDGNDISGDQNWVQGAIAGTQRETIDISEMPSHTHAISNVTTGITINSAGAHTHTVGNTGLYNNSNTIDGSVDDGQNEPNLYAGPQTTTTSTSGEHTHTITDPGHTHVAASTGGDVPINIMQPTIFVGNLYIYSGKKQHSSNRLALTHKINYVN